MGRKTKTAAGLTISAALAGLGLLAWRNRERLGRMGETFGEKIGKGKTKKY